MVDKMEKEFRNCTKLKFLEAKFIVCGFEIAKETWHPENSPSKKRCHVDNHVIFSSIPQVL